MDEPNEDNFHYNLSAAPREGGGGKTRWRGGTAEWLIPWFIFWKVSGEWDRDQPKLVNCSVS